MWDVLNSESEPITGHWWPIIDNCGCQLEPDIANAADQMAAGVMFALSGRQFGTHYKRIRPCFKDRCNMPVTPYMAPYVYLAEQAYFWDWAWVTCGCGRRGCKCTDPSTVVLPHHRIRSIIDVNVGPDTLDPANYRRSGRRLIRTDGESWPICQDDSVDIDDDGGWGVTYRWGKRLPVGGSLATGILACEIAKSLDGRDDCELPERVQTVTRQGVTIGFVDPMDFLENGRTGLYTVDLWLNSVNPNNLARRPGLLRADA